jgi:hypothetical protein
MANGTNGIAAAGITAPAATMNPSPPGEGALAQVQHSNLSEAA